MKKKLAEKHSKILLYEQLEQRLLFSVDVAPGLDIDVAHDQELVEDVAVDVQTDSATAEHAVQQNDKAVSSELVFVNDNVADYEQLISDLQQGDDNRIIEVVVLAADGDGIKHVSEILSQRSGLTAVHFITHGADGQINLGDSWLNSNTLQQNRDAVAGWGNALRENGDILFYGCSIAADSDGQILLDDIAELTGADAAASDDATGHDRLSADWELEYQAGLIEANIAGGDELQQNWLHSLATETVRDEFTTDGDFSQNVGTQNWSGPWTAIDATGATIAGGYFESTKSSGSAISTSDYWRQANLSGASSATLSFDVNAIGSTFGDNANDNIVVSVFDNDLSSWTSLETIVGSGINAPQTYSYDISATKYTAPNTKIRLQFNHQSGTIADDWVRIDNVQISYVTSDTTAPVQINNTGSTVAEGGTDTIGNTELRYDDDLQAATDVAYNVTAAPTSGQLELTTNPGVAINSFTQDDIDKSRLVYIHDDSETAADSFTFNVDDGQDNTLVDETFSITVTAVNDTPPVITSANMANVVENTTFVHKITQDDADLPGDSFTYTIIGGADQAKFLLDANSGVLTFASAPDFESPTDTNADNVYEVTVQASDGTYTDNAAMAISVTDANEAPTAAAVDLGNLNEDTSRLITQAELLAGSSDVDGDNLTAIGLTLNTGSGSLVDNGDGAWTFTPTADWNGAVSFNFAVSDGTVTTANTAALTVNAVDDASTFTSPDQIVATFETDKGEDSNAAVLTYENLAEDQVIEDEQTLQVEEYMTPQGAADANHPLVPIKNQEAETNEEIIYLTNENNTGTQFERRSDDRSFLYFENNLAREITIENPNFQYNKAAENMDAFSNLDFNRDYPDRLEVNEANDLVRQDIDESFNTEQRRQAAQAKLVTITMTSFSVGIVSYLLRAGSLLASLMSSLPLWHGFDPIAIFHGAKKKHKKDRNEISKKDGLNSEILFDGEEQ